MDFNHTEERQMLADMAGRFVREQYEIEMRHEIVASDEGWSREMWAQMAELGLIGALFSEDVGGFGGKGFDIAIIFEELGRGLVVEPFLPTLLAGTVLADGGESVGGIIEQAISGETLIAFAHGEPNSRYDIAHVETAAKKDGDGWVLNGNKAVVMGGDSADHLVLSARISGDAADEDGISLFLVPADADGVSRRGYGTVDGYRAAEISLDGVKVGGDALIGEEGKGYSALAKATAAGTLAVSAEALGAIDVAIDMTLDYLKTRKQFGVVIGKFQALQHRMADMMTEREMIRSNIVNAAGHLEGEERDWHVSAAKQLIGRSGRMIAEEAIQMHGGIAMTWEYAAGHYSKRIVMIDHLFGDVDHHTERLIEMGRARAA